MSWFVFSYLPRDYLNSFKIPSHFTYSVLSILFCIVYLPIAQDIKMYVCNLSHSTDIWYLCLTTSSKILKISYDLSP